MADVPKVLPTVVGRTRSARNEVRAVRIPSGWEEAAVLGNAGADLGDSAVRAAALVGSLQKEERETAALGAYNAAIAEADRRMNDEVYSQTGFSAQGALQRADAIYHEVGLKHSASISDPAISRRFSEQWAARRNSQANATMEFERNQVKAARISTNKSIISSELDNYAGTVDPSALGRVRAAYDDLYRQQNGGGVFDSRSLAAFDADVADGGMVKLPDGRSLKVVDSDSDSDSPAPGEVSKAQLAEIRAGLERRATAYEGGLRNLYDVGHSKVIDAYLKDNRVSSAEQYLSSISADGYPHPMSVGAKAEAEAAVKRHREAADISTEATAAMLRLSALGGRYGSAGQDKVFADTVAEIRKKHSGEQQKKGDAMISQLDINYRLMREQQNAALASDITSTLQQVQDSKLTLAQQESRVGTLAESPLKDALQKALARKRTAFDKQDDPVFVAEQEAALNQFKLDLAKGGAELDGVHYDFSNREQLKAYTLNLGLTGDNQKRAGQYISNSAGRIDATEAADVARDLLRQGGKNTPLSFAEVFQRYPSLLKDLEFRKGSAAIEPKEMRQWLKTNISELLNEKVQQVDWIFDNDIDRGKFINSDSPLTKQYLEPGQMEAAYRNALSRRLLQAGDVQGAADALTSAPDPDAVSEFARMRGYADRNNKGRYFLKGGR